MKIPSSTAYAISLLFVLLYIVLGIAIDSYNFLWGIFMSACGVSAGHLVYKALANKRVSFSIENNE